MATGKGRQPRLILELPGPPYRTSTNLSLEEKEYLRAMADYHGLRESVLLRRLVHNLAPPKREGKQEDSIRAMFERMRRVSQD